MFANRTAPDCAGRQALANRPSLYRVARGKSLRELLPLIKTYVERRDRRRSHQSWLSLVARVRTFQGSEDVGAAAANASEGGGKAKHRNLQAAVGLAPGPLGLRTVPNTKYSSRVQTILCLWTQFLKDHAVDRIQSPRPSTFVHLLHQWIKLLVLDI